MFWSYPEVAVRNLEDSYDYIIVGGGTAGCVLANRLSEDPTVSVLIIERGRVADTFLSRVPLLSSHFASDGSRSRVWKTTPQKFVDNRQIDLVGGNSMGGSSKINAMLYTRGLPADYNFWADLGRKGWSYNDMKSYFTRPEAHISHSADYVGEYHGTKGEWPNRTHQSNVWSHSDHIVKATADLGLPYIDDHNSPNQPSHGCTKLHYNIDANGRRSSTLTAFLPSALVRERRNRLHVCTRTTVKRIEIIKDEHGQLSADGVWVQADQARGTSKLIRACREVILTAGPIGSPQTLMLRSEILSFDPPVAPKAKTNFFSGIGPAEHLRELGIPVMKDLPGVGSNLQDHASVPLQFSIPVDDSLAKLQLRPWIIIKLFFLYIFFGTGLLLAPVIELTIFIQSRLFDNHMKQMVNVRKTDADPVLPQNLPDIEIMPISWGDVAKHGKGGLSFFVVPLRPESLGTVRLASSDPFANPVIDPRYLSTENDRTIMRKAVRFALHLKSELAAQKYPIFDFDIPASNSDEDVDEFVRRGLYSTNHYSSTCRMAPEAEGGVLDDQLYVHGITRLRVSDSSAFPHILSAHLAAATVAVAEKCSDMVHWRYNQAKTTEPNRQNNNNQW